MSWLLLVVAGLFETGWAVALKYSEGFTRLWPSAVTVVLMAISIVLLALAMKQLAVGTAYAVWTGIGAVGTVVLGIILFNDPVSAGRMLCLALIVAGIVGLKVVSPQ